MFLIKAILMTMLPFYRLDFPVIDFPEYFTYVEYKQGHEFGTKTVAKDDATYIELMRLISTEKQGWRYDLATYAPNRMFSASKIKINCSGQSLVVNYVDNNNDWIQISKSGMKGSCPLAHS